MANIKKCILICFFIILYFIFSNTVNAQEFRNEYKAEYFPDGTGKTRVELNIKITNLRSDVYVNKFSISFPKTFPLDSFSASDDKGAITPEIKTDDRSIKVNVTFSNPNTGRNSVNNFYLRYYQDKLFSANGNVWEVILPTINDETDSPYNIVVHLPPDTGKKVSIAKPKPDLITGNTVYWNNVKTRTVYAVFGDSQYYKMNLTYHLPNDQLVPVYFEVAFPPETQYQKILIDSINPPPEKTYLDEDGNFIGKFTVGAKETKKIQFSGFAQVFVSPQDDLKPYIENLFEKSKNYLLTQKKYWRLGNYVTDPQIMTLKSAPDIYSYVANKLSYDYSRITQNNKRLGAEKIMSTPEKAVCMEFTDLYVAIAREKGIYAREINGYGFNNDENLRPLSLGSDILHSWPEFYDGASSRWIPIDPTWENTSGIDYLNSFDVNHIVFSIHGKDPEYPPAAGMYKVSDTKDVDVTVADTIPAESPKTSVETSFKNQIIDNIQYTGSVKIKNTGNSFIKNLALDIKSANLAVTPNHFTSLLLAPYEEKVFPVTYQADKEAAANQTLVAIKVSDGTTIEQTIKIHSFWGSIIYITIGIFVGLAFIGFIYAIIRRRKNTFSS